MYSAWQRFTLSDLNLYRWRGASFLYRLVGLLSGWRQGSWLLQWAETIGLLLISLVLVTGPFVSTSLIGLLLVACGSYCFLFVATDNTRIVLTPVHLLVFMYWGIATVATAFSPVKEAAFSGWIKLTLYIVFFALASLILRSATLRSWAIGIFLHAALIVSVYGIRQEIFGAEQLATWNDPTSQLAQDTRAYSYLGNPNLLAGYLLTAVALSLAAFFVWRLWLPKILAATMILVNTACLYFTDSRGGWIGMLALILVFLLLLRVWWAAYLPSFWRKWLLPIVFGCLAAFLIAAAIFVEPLRLRVMSIFAGREDSSNNFRMNVWAAVFKMISDRPLIGIGPGNDAFNAIYPIYQQPRFTALSAYSIFLEIAVETGIIGLSAFLWLIIVTYQHGYRTLVDLRESGNKQGYWLIASLAALAGMLAHGVVDTVWYRPQISSLWWLSMAIVASFYQLSNMSNDNGKAVQ